MDFVALVSGGKDSIYSIKCSIDQGHRLVGLLYMKNTSSYADSYMYQTVGSEVVEHFGKCLDVPLFTSVSQCKAIDTELNYTGDREDEVEDLFKALSEIKKKIKFEAISSGAILSRYQKNRVEHVANRLNLVSLSPLWQRDQKILLKEMLDYEIEAFIVKVASSFLDKSYLGKHIRSIYESNALLDDNYCGEGGEYESVVLDCPLFKHKLEYKDFTIVNHPEEQDGFGSVFYCVFNGLQLIKK